MVITIKALLFDAGNTRLKWGVLTDGRISRTGAVTTDKLHDEGFGVVTSKLPRKVSHAVVSNVAGPGFATRLSSVVGLHCGIDLRIARCEREAFGVTTSYRQPRRLGVDRWLAIIGAWSEFHSALCIADAGTALTIDAVDKAGLHIGGQIVPGMRLMSEALHAETSDLPATGRTMKDPGDGLGIFASNTRDAIVNGSLNATCGAIERAAGRMRSTGLRPKIVLTGGDASRILKQLKGNAIHRPNLVLQGLAKMVLGDS